MHVQILIGAQPPAEQHLGLGRLGLGPGPVGRQQGAIGLGVDRIVGLVVVGGEARVLAHDHGLVRGVVALGVEMPELVDPGVGHIGVVVVHDRCALEITRRQHLELEVQRAPPQPALGVVEVAVQGAGVDHRRVGVGAPQLVAHVEPVGVAPHLDALVGGHVLQPGGVPVDRQPLVGVVEVAVVERVAHRQPGDVGGGQLLGIGLPLLGGVVLDERLVERAADQRDRLLLQVLRVLGLDLAGLLADQRPRFVWREIAAEELTDQPQSHRELVGLPVVEGEDPVLVAGELGELAHVVPHPPVGGVEQVRAVAVHLDTGLGFGFRVGVAAEVGASLEDQHALVQLRGRPFGDRQAEETRADDEEVPVLIGLGQSCHRQQGYPTAGGGPE